jgi:hypothetical protein
MMTKARWLQPLKISALEMLTKTSNGKPSIQPAVTRYRPPSKVETSL